MRQLSTLDLVQSKRLRKMLYLSEGIVVRKAPHKGRDGYVPESQTFLRGDAGSYTRTYCADCPAVKISFDVSSFVECEFHKDDPEVQMLEVFLYRAGVVQTLREQVIICILEITPNPLHEEELL